MRKQMPIALGAADMRPSRSLAALAVTATLITGLLFVPGTAFAGTHAVRAAATHDRPNPHVKRFELRGTIATVNPKLHKLTATVRVRRHGETVRLSIPLVLANNAVIRVNGAVATQADLMVGDRVEIHGVVLPPGVDGEPRVLLGLRVRARGTRDVPPQDAPPAPPTTNPEPTHPEPAPSSNAV
jgi:hypothetical protein